MNYKENPIKYKNKNSNIKDFISINNININNIHNQNIRIATNSVNAIVGKSGSGKSSLSRYIEKNIINSIYISQKEVSKYKIHICFLPWSKQRYSKLFF